MRFLPPSSFPSIPSSPDADCALASGRLPAASLGHLASCTRTGGVATQCELTAELAKADGREEARVDGPDNGVFGAKRDHEFGVVPADCADDDEHWSLDASRGMDCGRDGQIYQGTQGIRTGVGRHLRDYNRSSSSVVPFRILLTLRLCITLDDVNPSLFRLNVDQVQSREIEFFVLV